MNKKILFFISIICVILLITNIISLLNQDVDLNREDSTKASIHIWTTTPRLSYILHQYEIQSNVRINLKQFHDTEALLEELEFLRTENAFPDLIEMDARNGIDSLPNDYDPIPLEKLAPDMAGLFHESIVDNFSEEHGLLAYPLGIEVPLLLVNQSFIDNQSGMIVYPFQSGSHLNTFEELQKSVNENNHSKNFWFFHFDENIPWYWTSHKLSASSESRSDFQRMWKDLTRTYNLMPPLDHHMALTRFSNMEIGVLISGSDNLQTLQKSIGNDFEFEAHPLLLRRDDNILVSGHGMIALRNKEEIKDLFTFLNHKEVQQDLLSKTGSLPAQIALLESKSFMQSLPMSKYLTGLTGYRDQFIGMIPDEGAIDWKSMMDTVDKIESGIN